MLVYYFVQFIVSNRYLLFWVSNGHNSVTVQNRAHVYMNFFHHKDLGNHLLQLCPKVVKHPVYEQFCALPDIFDYPYLFRSCVNRYMLITKQNCIAHYLNSRTAADILYQYCQTAAITIVSVHVTIVHITLPQRPLWTFIITTTA